MTAKVSNVQRLSPVEDSASVSESFFGVRLLKNANPTRLPMDQWFEQYFVNGFAGPVRSRASATVGGRLALRVEASGIGRWAHVYVPVDSDVTEVFFEVSQTGFVGQYEAMLASLQFPR
jgi:hypothetical protein